MSHPISPLTAARLKQDCHRLIDKLANHPNALTQLLVAHQWLGIIAGCKRAKKR